MQQATSPQQNNPVTYPRTLRPAILKAAIFLSLFTVFAVRASAQLGAYTFNVPGTTPWFDTGIDITAGWQLRVGATGLVTYNTGLPGTAVADANGGDWLGGNFFSTAVYSNAEIHSLIGKIGGTTDLNTGNPVPSGLLGQGAGFVGKSYTNLILNSGRLFLGYNDEPPYFFDNAGSFAVNITVVPEPSTIGLLGLGILLLLGKRLATRLHA
jgi:hypothetical protein